MLGDQPGNVFIVPQEQRSLSHLEVRAADSTGYQLEQRDCYCLELWRVC